MSRRDFPRTDARSDPTPPTSTSGHFNSGRRVPAPRTRPPTSRPPETSLPPPMATASKAAQRDSFVTRIIVMVDDATEPGIPDEESAQHRNSLMDVLLNRKTDLPPRTPNISPGQAVSFAIRKRLKSEDEAAVLNTLVLLDEFMRTVPYFYRYVANEKFFRRLWRFVVPDYKNQMKSMIPIFGRPKSHLGMRGPDSEVSSRVLILIRAWAEELSVMFHGRQDPDAGFLIERYRDKRLRVPFPEVPKTGKPWVCAVPSQTSTIRGAGSSRAGASSSNGVENMTLDEVENTVKLFSALVDNATSVDELNEEVYSDMAQRCQYFSDNMTNMTMNLKEEEQLPRAVTASENLQRALSKYNSILENGQLGDANNAPIETVSLDSDEDGYDDIYHGSADYATQNIRRLSLQSDERRSSDARRSGGLRRLSPEKGQPTARNDDVSRDRSRDLNFDRDRERDRERADRERANRERADRERTDRERERADRERADRERERADREREDRERSNRERARTRGVERPRARDEEVKRERNQDRKPRDRAYQDDDESDGSDDIRPTRASNRSAPSDAKGVAFDKRTRRGTTSKSSFSRREKSDGDLPEDGGRSSRKKSDRKVANDNLIDVHGDEGDDDDVEGNGERNDQSFTMLAERYESKKSRSSRPKSAGKSSSKSGGRQSTSRSGASAAAATTESRALPANSGAPAGTPSAPGMVAVPPGMDMAAMYQSNLPNFGMNPMMMVPNPYAMYGSVNTMGMQDPMSMFGAYSTVNPAMYYQSMNPSMLPQMMAPMGGMGAGGMTVGGGVAGASGAGAGVTGSRVGASAGAGVAVAGNNIGSGQSVADNPSGATAAPPNMTGSMNNGTAGAGNDNEGQVDGSSASGAGLAGPMMAPMAPSMAPMTSMAPMAPMQGMGLSKEDAENQAAAYQSAMQQAATAYHMAASAFKTMQGQAAIAQTNSPTGPSLAISQVTSNAQPSADSSDTQQMQPAPLQRQQPPPQQPEESQQ